MAAILQLPDELLLQIQSRFLLPDLERFASVCRRFASVSYRRCEQHRALHQKYKRLDAFEEPLGWFNHLVTVLRNPDVAFYIQELHIPTCEWFYRELPSYDPTVTLSESDFELVCQAARDSPWISEHDACGKRGSARNMLTFLHEIREGDQDNILAVLVPLLPNLEKIELPAQRYGGLKMGSLPGVVERIAKASDASNCFPFEFDLPLSSLHDVVGLNDKYNPISRLGFGVDFAGLAPFLAIPSVRRCFTLETHEPMFDWPDDLPRSRVQEIEFLEASISEPAARALAKGIRGPLVMKQDFVMHTHDTQDWPPTPPREHWQKLEIPYKDAPQRDWITTRYGIPKPERKLSAKSTLVMAARLAVGVIGANHLGN